MKKTKTNNHNEKWELQKESELMKKLLKNDNGIRYDWEDVKKKIVSKLGIEEIFTGNL